ncbi:ABC transporter permease [Salegentibacter sp. JZCK2]|uniref:ABC transporter permease n=1 Tax=Salegentibacter tibetensis TaxID=2873600 RepID=UPI001CC9BDFC|nr:ABC transporter permease [Salegentibacter tibetensis]MBZ9731140.1 ABC transporter permease [Salegentibacter tibetensis]
MIKNHFKIAWRNMMRHKGFSFLNIAGLALGFTACFLIALFIWDEHQFDKFLPEGERVYRVYNHFSDSNRDEMNAPTFPMIATTLKQDFPEVEQTARILMLPEGKELFETDGKKMYVDRGFFVDSTFFEVFPLELKYGSRDGALDEPASIVISEEMAEQFFGNENPVGKEIIMNQTPLTVKAVIKKNPKFHLQINSLLPLSLAGIPAERMESWGWMQFYNYLKLKEGADAGALEAKFQPLVHQKTQEFSDGREATHKVYLQPLHKIHLYSSNFVYDNAKRGNITYLRALTFIAIFILLIACFNFINLATAKSLQRAKEVGVRKSIGANRKQLIFQFIGETVFLTLISIVLSLILTLILLPWLNEFTGKEIEYSIFTDPLLLLSFLGITLTVGILAGIYPALVLSNFKPVKVLKGSVLGDHEPGKIPFLRHGLVVIQFTLSVLLIISAIVVYNQVNYLHNKDLGFNKDQIMFFPLRGANMQANKESFKMQLEQLPGVSSVSIGYGFPGDAVAGDGIKVHRNGLVEEQGATQLMVDFDYIETLGIEMVAGRPFSEEMGTDKDKAFIINETAVKNLGYGTPENALGQKLSWNIWNNVNQDSIKEGQIIGVVKDFNYKSLYEKVETTVLQIFPPAASKVAVKMESTNIGNTIDKVEGVWNTFSPDYPLEYRFLDDSFEKMYLAEDKLKSLLGIFTGLAIFVGCLGLFGLAAFSAERRKREIGIRKVLGASVENIVVLMSKDFVKLVIISLVIASPIAWYFMNGWLQDFAYRINIGWYVFAVAGVTAIGIALLTVGFHAVKAAMGNPVENIRTE